MTRCRGAYGTCFLLVAVLAILGTAFAQAGPSVGASGRASAGGLAPESHGWIIVPAANAARQGPGSEPTAENRQILLHLPPRQASIHEGTPGIGRRSRSLEQDPLGIAAVGRRVYLLTANSRTGDAPDRRRYLVRTIEAWPTAVPGIWSDRPAGRMESLTPLEVDGEVIGFAATNAGPAALIRSGSGLTVARHDGSEWAFSEVPSSDAVDPLGEVLLLGSPDRLSVVGERGVICRNADQDEWSERAIEIPDGVVAIGLVGDAVLAWQRTGRSVSITLHGPDRADLLAVLPDLASGAFLGVVPIFDLAGRLAVVIGETDPGLGSANENEGQQSLISYRFIELSLSTGAVLYDGPLRRVAPVSPEEFRILAAALILMMVVSLMIVLRPVPSEADLTIPDGCALASPGRRLVATGLDLILSALIVSRVTGVPFGEIMSLGVLLAPDQSWLALPSVLFVGLSFSTLSETLFSASPGKLLLGCRVARATKDGGRAIRIGFGRALVRNGVKWILPPAASLALIDPMGRHRGDLLADAVVVIRPDGGEDGGEDAEREDDEAHGE